MKPGAILVLAACLVTAAAAPQPLDQTQLYKSLTRDCRELNLATWSHPTKQVMRDNGVKLARTELCNDGKYPIFTVELPYDPRGLTTDWTHKLYARMLRANGDFPFSFVDLTDDVIVNIGVDKQHVAHVTYEDFTPSPSGR